MTYRLISTDSHADAPAEVYRANVAEKFQDAIPHLQLDDDGATYLYVRGRRVMTMSNAPWAPEPGPRQKFLANEGAWEPEKRLGHLDRDQVAAEVVQGGACWVLMDPDPEAQLAVCRVWNDWAMSVYKPYQSRIQPSAVLPIRDIPAAIKEVQRLAALGYTNLQMPINPVEKPYRDPDYDPLWAVLQETGLTVNLHLRSGTRKSAPFKAGRVYNFTVDCVDGIITAVDLCSSGVLERFPGLKVVFVEVGGGWASWLMHTMDGIYHAHPETSIPLKRLPSEYFKQNIACSIMMDTAALRNAKDTGVGILLFSNDYPHPEGTWPESQRLVAKQLAGMGLSDEEIAQFTHKNAERLYKFPAVTPSTKDLLATVAA